MQARPGKLLVCICSSGQIPSVESNKMSLKKATDLLGENTGGTDL